MPTDNSIKQALQGKRNQYEPAFVLLVNDFVRVCEYIEPTDAHLDTYSHRLYELLLRGCTEFESLCREILGVQGAVERREHLNIHHFAEIEPLLELRKQVAVLAFWRPEPIQTSPFSEWSTTNHSLPWYKGYNAVKHNRNTEFAHANLRNVRDALSAVFIILARLDFLEVATSVFSAPGGFWQGTTRYRDLPFSLQYETSLPIGLESHTNP